MCQKRAPHVSVGILERDEILHGLVEGGEGRPPKATRKPVIDTFRATTDSTNHSRDAKSTSLKGKMSPTHFPSSYQEFVCHDQSRGWSPSLQVTTIIIVSRTCTSPDQ